MTQICHTCTSCITTMVPANTQVRKMTNIWFQAFKDIITSHFQCSNKNLQRCLSRFPKRLSSVALTNYTLSLSMAQICHTCTSCITTMVPANTQVRKMTNIWLSSVQRHHHLALPVQQQESAAMSLSLSEEAVQCCSDKLHTVHNLYVSSSWVAGGWYFHLLDWPYQHASLQLYEVCNTIHLPGTEKENEDEN